MMKFPWPTYSPPRESSPEEIAERLNSQRTKGAKAFRKKKDRERIAKESRRRNRR